MKRPNWMLDAGTQGLSNKVRLLSVLAVLGGISAGATATAAVVATGAVTPGKRTINLVGGPAGPAGPKGDAGPAGVRGPAGPAGENDGTFLRCPTGYEYDDLTINHPTGHVTILVCVKE